MTGGDTYHYTNEDCSHWYLLFKDTICTQLSILQIQEKKVAQKRKFRNMLRKRPEASILGPIFQIFYALRDDECTIKVPVRGWNETEKE